MRSRLAVLVLVLLACLPSAAHADDPWIEVKSPKFIVVSNAIGHARASRAMAQTDAERGAAEEAHCVSDPPAADLTVSTAEQCSPPS